MQHQTIKDSVSDQIINFAADSEEPFDHTIYANTIIDEDDDHQNIEMIASILTMTEHDANILIRYINNGVFKADLGDILKTESIIISNITIETTLKILEIKNADSNDGFSTSTLIVIIVICIGCYVLTLIAFLFGYYRGRNVNGDGIPSKQPSLASAASRSTDDIERIKKLELELEKAKLEKMELEKKAKKRNQFSPTLSSGIYHKPSTIMSEGDKSKYIMTQPLDDNMIIGDTKRPKFKSPDITGHHRKPLKHIYESVQHTKGNKDDGVDDNVDYNEASVDSDDFFLEPNTLNQEGIITKQISLDTKH